MRRFGLVGKTLQHSFSKTYFESKFHDEKISDCRYDLFPIPDISGINAIIDHYPDLEGLNITIPFKKNVIPYLHFIDPEADQAGSVNTIKIVRNGKNTILKGFNTDVYGFELSLAGLLPVKGALILGSGGASAAVGFVLNKLKIPFFIVSRNPYQYGMIGYDKISTKILENHPLIINTTPAGMFPDTESCPDIPYDLLTEHHILYDLIYNPEKTLFLNKGLAQGACIKNGLQMLYIQADKAWDIWNGK